MDTNHNNNNNNNHNHNIHHQEYNNANLESRIESFVNKQHYLLQLEYSHSNNHTDDADTDDNISDDDRNTCNKQLLKHMILMDQFTIGLFGKSVYSFGKQQVDLLPLPAHDFSTGDDVEIIRCCRDDTSNTNIQNRSNASNLTADKYQMETEKSVIPGVISKVNESSISIILHDDDDDIITSPSSNTCSEYYHIRPRISQEVRKRMDYFLNQILLAWKNQDQASSVIHKLFADDKNPCRKPCQKHQVDVNVNWFNDNLDESQKEAILFALNLNNHHNDEVALIHGPPGTGKTTSVVELIRQAVFHKGWKVLVCAPSNVAVDNLLERLVTATSSSSSSDDRKDKERSNRGRKFKTLDSRNVSTGIPKVVRLGHPARLQPTILQHSLEVLVGSADGTEIVKQCRDELKHWISVSTNPKSRFAEKRAARVEMKLLRKEIKSREQKVVRELLHSRNVVLCTNIGAASRILDDVEFDLVVIDEAAQALEASCWVPILHGKRLVLAGDHNQLPPTIKSRKASKEGLDITLFDRLIRAHKDNLSRMLTVQYRMHKDISDWASHELYNDKLQPASCVANHKLSDLPHVLVENETSSIVLLMIDTSGCDMHESVTKSASKFNEGEAHIVALHVKALVDSGLLPEDIGVITPYNGQVDLLREMLLESFPKIEIRSVDGFQGGEKEAVVLSLVRSSEKGGIGFLSDERRLNVAVTRARRQCTLICDSEHVSRNSKFLERLVQWFDDHGEVRSAMEYETMSSKTIHKDDIEKMVMNEGFVSRNTTNKIQLSLSRNKKDNTKQESRVVDQKDDANCIREKRTQDDSKRKSNEKSTRKESVTEELSIKELTSELKTSVIEPNRTNIVEYNTRDSLPCSTPILVIKQGHDSSEKSMSNNILAELAKERRERQQLKMTMKNENSKELNSGQRVQKKSTKDKKGRGKTKPRSRSSSKSEVNNDHIEDDMAFLDAEIDKVQNSHGRKVEGTGKNYRTIVNGILIAKPTPAGKRRDQRAAKSLRSKLKQAECDRKAKSKKK